MHSLCLFIIFPLLLNHLALLNFHKQNLSLHITFKLVFLHSDIEFSFIGSFELALIRLCRVYESSTKRVIFGSVFLPLKAFAAFSKYVLKISSQQFFYVCLL